MRKVKTVNQVWECPPIKDDVQEHAEIEVLGRIRLRGRNGSGIAILTNPVMDLDCHVVSRNGAAETGPALLHML